MKALFEVTSWKKYLLILVAIVSFVLVRGTLYLPTISLGNTLVTIIFMLGYGVFYWLLFEFLVGFFYSATKTKFEKNISSKQFLNVFRVMIILVNLIMFALNNLFILLNFYTVYLMLITSVLVMFAMFVGVIMVINKYYFEGKLDKETIKTYFSFVFVYLCVHSFMWGAL